MATTKKDTFNYKNKKYLEFVAKLDKLNMQKEQLVVRKEREREIQKGYAGVEAVRAQPKRAIEEKEKKKTEKRIQKDYAGVESIRATPKKNKIDKMTSEEFLGEKLSPVQKFLRYGFGKTPTIGEKKKQYKTSQKLDIKVNSTKIGQIQNNFQEYLLAATTGEQAKAIKPTGNKVIDTATAITGSIAGYLAPVGGVGGLNPVKSIGGTTQELATRAIDKLGKTKLPNNLLQKMSPKIANIVTPIVSTLFEGVGTSIPITGLQSARQEMTAEETIKTGLKDALVSTLLLGAGKGIKAGAGKIREGIDESLTPSFDESAQIEESPITTKGSYKVSNKKLTQQKINQNEIEVVGSKEVLRNKPEINKVEYKNNKNWTGRNQTKANSITQVKKDKFYTQEERTALGLPSSQKTSALNKVYQSIIDNPKSSEIQIKKAQEQIKKVSEITKIDIEQPIIKSEQPIKPTEIKKTKLDIPEETLRDKNKFDSYYNLDKKLDKNQRITVIDRLTKDIGSRIINKSNSKTLEDIVNYYKNKYKLPNNFKINRSLRSQSKYAKIVIPKDGIKADTEIRISVNPTKSFDNQVGALRHEIEHWKDSIEGYKSTEPKYAVGDTLRKTYGGKGSHKNYDFFEPDYLRQAYLKDLEKGKLETTEPVVEPVEPAKTDIVENVKEVKREPVKVENSEKTYAPPKEPPYTNETIKNNPMKKSKHEQTVLGSNTTDPEFRKYLSQKRPVEYETTVNQQDWDNARERLSKNSPDKIFESQKQKKSLTAEDTHDLIALHEYYTKKGDLDKANEVLTELTLKGSKSGQFIQAMAVWDRQTTEGMLKLATSNKIKANVPESTLNKESKLKTEVQELRNTIKELEKNPAKNKNEIELNLQILSGKEKNLSQVTEKVKDSYALGKLTTEEYNYIKTRYDNARSKEFYDNAYKTKLKKLQGSKLNPSPRDIYKATQYADRQILLEKTRAMQKISDLEGSTGREKFRAFQRITMLSTPSTTARNNISNALTSLVDIGIRENLVAAPIDYLTAAIRTKSLISPIKFKQASGRTTIMSPSKSIAYGKGFIKGIADIGRDIKDSIKYKEWIDTNPARENFELAGKRIYKNKILNVADQIVRKMVTDRPFYEAAYQARLKELSIINKTKKPTPEMINNSKLYALDKVFQNNSTIAKTMTTIRKKVPPLDLIMPFTQTPANLMDKLADYSPVSLVKMTKQIAQSKSKPIDTKLFIDRLSRMMTGAGIAVLGYKLAEKGILTGALDKKSEKKREFQKAKGEQYYSIKIGDNYYSYDWLSPVGNILASATDFYKSGQGKESFIDKLESSTIGGIDTVMSQSMLKGLLNLFSGYSPATGMIKSFSESTTQANPTIIKKIAASIDEYERDTQADGFLKTTGNKWLSGIPVQREKLGIKRNVFGNSIKSKDIVTNLFAPARSTKSSKDKTIKEIDKLYTETKNSDVLPRVAQKTISYTPKFKNFGRTIVGEKVSYNIKTSQDRSEYTKLLGQYQKKAVDTIINSSDYKYMDNETKVKEIAKAYKTAKDEAVYKFLKNKKLITE